MSKTILLIDHDRLNSESQQKTADLIRGLAESVRTHTDIPVAIGFGISNADHVAEVAGYADGAIVGSELINRLADGDTAGAAERAGSYIQSLSSGTSRKVVAN